MLIVMYCGLVLMAALIWWTVYFFICLLRGAEVDTDTFQEVPMWRSVLALHTYGSLIFPCHWHCCVWHALLALIHFNLVTLCVAGLGAALTVDSGGTITQAIVVFVAVVVPQFSRPLMNYGLFFYTFDERDRHLAVTIDFRTTVADLPSPNRDGEQEQDRPSALRQAQSTDVGSEASPVKSIGKDTPALPATPLPGFESPQARRTENAQPVRSVRYTNDRTASPATASTIEEKRHDDALDMDSFSSFGEVELPRELNPFEASAAYNQLNSFNFDFLSDDEESKSFGASKGELRLEPLASSRVGTLFADDFAPLQYDELNTPRPVPIEMPPEKPEEWMPITTHGLLKTLALIFIFVPLVVFNFALTTRIRDSSPGYCDGQMDGFMKAFIAAQLIDIFVAQQVFVGVVWVWRALRADEDGTEWSELHPSAGEMRPISPVG